MIKSRRQKAEGRSLTKSLFVLYLCLLPSAFCLAQDKYTPTNPIPLGDNLLTLPTSHIPSEGTWEIKFTHRFNGSIDQGNGSDRAHNLFGLDSNADVGIGFSYAPRRDMQFSLLRSNALDDVELALKYVVIQQAKAVPFSAAIRVGGDWRTEQNLKDRSSIFGQVVLSHQFGRRAEVFIMPTYATDAGRVTNGTTSQALFKHAFNAPLGAAVMIRPALSIVGELIPKNHDLPDNIHADFGWAVGLKRAIGGHYFEVLVTNSNATHVDQYVTSTYQGAGLDRGDLHLGFNIERRFGK
ncbi:MAG TPA: DUF5777 family beta-barrel protein [Thermoanaerobaculia bacterium]|nr:DUF5777 family beta-barrel protein [Thermoanaerobaculia bacterium]